MSVGARRGAGPPLRNKRIIRWRWRRRHLSLWASGWPRRMQQRTLPLNARQLKPCGSRAPGASRQPRAREASSSPSCAWTVGPCVRARRDRSSLSHHCNPQRLTDTSPRLALACPPEKEKQKEPSFRAIAARSARAFFVVPSTPRARVPVPVPGRGRKRGESATRSTRAYVRSLAARHLGLRRPRHVSPAPAPPPLLQNIVYCICDQSKGCGRISLRDITLGIHPFTCI
jgi:hypothetical protein